MRGYLLLQNVLLANLLLLLLKLMLQGSNRVCGVYDGTLGLLLDYDRWLLLLLLLCRWSWQYDGFLLMILLDHRLMLLWVLWMLLLLVLYDPSVRLYHGSLLRKWLLLLLLVLMLQLLLLNGCSSLLLLIGDYSLLRTCCLLLSLLF